MKKQAISIKEYLEKMQINATANTIDELYDLKEMEFVWSYCIEDKDEIKNWGDVELVQDSLGNQRYFETGYTLPF